MPRLAHDEPLGDAVRRGLRCQTRPQAVPREFFRVVARGSTRPLHDGSNRVRVQAFFRDSPMAVHRAEQRPTMHARVIGVLGSKPKTGLRASGTCVINGLEQASAREQKGSSDVFSHVSLNHFSIV